MTTPFEAQILILRYGVIVLLYVFLAAILYLAWKDLQTVAQRGGRPRRPLGELVVVDAGETGLAPGDRLPLQLITSLGRDLSNTIVLPDAFASNTHALVTYRDGEWWLEDLGSRNGTFLNDARVTGPTALREGDLITIGRVVMRYVCPPPA